MPGWGLTSYAPPWMHLHSEMGYSHSAKLTHSWGHEYYTAESLNSIQIREMYTQFWALNELQPAKWWDLFSNESALQCSSYACYAQGWKLTPTHLHAPPSMYDHTRQGERDEIINMYKRARIHMHTYGCAQAHTHACTILTHISLKNRPSKATHCAGHTLACTHTQKKNSQGEWGL